MYKVKIAPPKSIGQPEGNGKSRPMTEAERIKFIKKLQTSKYEYK